MAIVRLGTCGAVQRPAKLGDLLIATHGSIAIHRNPDFWTLGLESGAPAAITSLPTSSTASSSNGNGNGNGSPGGHVRASGSSFAYADTGLGVEGVKPYRLCLPVPADAELSALLVHEAAAAVGSGRVVQGLNASADSFYSSQVRYGL